MLRRLRIYTPWCCDPQSQHTRGAQKVQMNPPRPERNSSEPIFPEYSIVNRALRRLPIDFRCPNSY